ncbi:MAG: MFS transporter [Acidimicrobiia bacterium]|nr:MFS transporter [Acidimicrobiia bacterium]
MTLKPRLPLPRQIAYAVGQLGWSTLINVVGLALVYFYLPPDSAGLPPLITTVTFLGVLNALTLIAASGRLLDAITDPLIASWSDRTTNRRGRRIPFLAFGALPAALFLVLMFVPPVQGVSGWNIVWLVVVQALFYVSLTVYVTPFFALLPELGHTPTERLNLSTWISVTYALGIILAAQAPTIADVLQSALNLDSELRSFQLAVGLLAFLALIFMYVPVLAIDEKKYSDGVPTSVPLMAALGETLRNVHFRYYVVADFSYFTGLTIITTGLLYYVTVLLLQEEALVGTLLAITVVVSFLFYPLVNLLAKRIGKKPLVVLSFLVMSTIFLGIFFLGRFPLSDEAQAYALVLLYAIPLAFLGVLPNAVLADIAEHDAQRSGERKEGMFFAARTLMQKFGQTFGVLIFAMLTTFGKDPGDDLGIRLSGMVGFVLTFVAGLVFTRYDERKVLDELAKAEESV